MQSDFTPTKKVPVTGIAAALAAGLMMLTLIACAALGITPALTGAARPSATTAEPQPWSIVEISKPTQTPTVEPTAAPALTEPTTGIEGDAGATQAPTGAATDGAATAEAMGGEATSGLTMRIVDDSELLTAAPPDAAPSYSGGKTIQVSIREQHLYAYDNDQLIYSFVASTGMGNSTRVGTFHVLDKIPNAYGSTWNIWMPNWMGIYYSGGLENGIHALPILPGGARLWAGYLGTPISFGCVVLGVNEALQIYNWADIGTPVEISW